MRQMDVSNAFDFTLPMHMEYQSLLGVCLGSPYGVRSLYPPSVSLPKGKTISGCLSNSGRVTECNDPTGWNYFQAI